MWASDEVLSEAERQKRCLDKESTDLLIYDCSLGMERDDVFADHPGERNPLALDQETLLNDQFRIGRVLGVGGFGITYLAFDEVLEMVVAVKEYLPNDIAVRKSDSNTVQPYTSTGDNRDFEFGLKQFLEEARTLAKFENHPNIVRVRTFFRENGTGYLVMNFYEGRTLAEYLEARNGFLMEQEALLMMEQVIEGLAAVHEQNVLHRDIDPSNVYLADNGTVVLLDFGAARTAVGERTQTMSVVLKRGYAPQEQYHSHGDQGAWTDVYACASTLYRTLTGYKPPEAAARILEDDLVAPKELVPSLSDDTNEAILQGLAVRPENRPQTMDAFAELLPDPPSEAKPRWIGELTTLQLAAEAENASGELEITATHPCRLYVDGNQTAEIAAEESYTIGVPLGSHRLRVVRTDQENTGSATVTASGDALDEGETDSQKTLDTLVWQDVVSVSSTEAPLVLEVDFEGEEADADVSSPQGGEPAPNTTPAGGGAGTNPDEVMATVEASGNVEETAAAGGTEETVAASAAAEGAGETTVGHAATEETERQADAPIQKHASDYAERAVSAAESVMPDEMPSTHAVKRNLQRLGGGARRTLRTAGRVLGRRSRDLWRLVQRGGAIALKWGRAAAQSGTPRQQWGYGGVGIAGLLLLCGLGWWMAAGEVSSLSGTASSSPAVPVVTTVNSATFNAVDHYGAADTVAVRLAGVGAIRDSGVTATVVDSARLRVQSAGGFAGTARIPYEIVAGDDSVQAAVRLQVPFTGEGRRVTGTVERPQVVRADSIGGDDALDVVVGALGGQSVTWNESVYTSESGFGASIPIETDVDGVVDVTTADVSGNNRSDVVAVSLKDDLVMWYKNRSEAAFGERRTIDADADGAGAVATADIDGDGDSDVVAGTVLSEAISWYENGGDGEFGEKATFVEDLGGLEALHVADLNENGRPEVLAVSYKESVIHRYEPTDSTADSLQVVEQPPLGKELDEPISVHTADVVGDGRKDLLVGTVGTNSLLLFENRTGQDDERAFGKRQVLISDLRTIESIDTGDLDKDGDQDIVAAAFESDTVTWLQNKGDGTFAPPETIDASVPGVISVQMADVDSNGMLDVVVASQAENAVDWYKNHLSRNQETNGRDTRAR